MNTSRRHVMLGVLIIVATLSGCGPVKVDFADIQRPPRPAELDAYDAFVGSWNWEAQMLNAEGPDKKWSGKAEWKWALDKRCLQGTMSAKSAKAEFEAVGIWSWHPKTKKHIWSMFNNWGYPQAGTATYDADAKCWTMTYESVGLDGTMSYGQYQMTVVDKNTLDWHMDEWVDMTRVFKKKIEMTGKYKRR